MGGQESKPPSSATESLDSNGAAAKPNGSSSSSIHQQQEHHPNGNGSTRTTASTPTTTGKNTNNTDESFQPEMTRRTRFAHSKDNYLDNADAAQMLDQLLQKNHTLDTSGSVMNMRIPTNRQAQNKVKEDHGEDSLEHKALHFLHQPKTQVFLGVLLFLDILFLFTELALLTFYPHCRIVQRDAISCCTTTTTINNPDDAHHRQRQLLLDQLRLLAGSTADSTNSHHDDDHHYCEQEGTVPQFESEAGCDEHKWHKVHTAEEVLYYLTMVILFTFLAELLLLVWALKPKVFFRQFFYVLDLFIIMVSITLELVFHHGNEESLQALSGLIILGRVWRFVRIGHGLVELTAELTRDQYHVLIEYTRDLESKMQAHGVSLPDSELAERAREMCVSGPILEEEEEEAEESGVDKDEGC